MRPKIKTIFLFALMAFVSNFIWESWHASYLYAAHTFNLSFWPLMAYAASIDMLLLLGIFCGGALVWKERWFARDNRKDIALQHFYIMIVGVIVAALVEYKAVYVFHQWIYSNMMPTIFGLGLSPLVQLALTGLLSVSIARQAIRISK